MKESSTTRVTVEIEGATDSDLEDVERLLALVELPLAGLQEQFPEAYVVARAGRELIGLAGLERYGDAGLLRSVAVVPSRRGTGLGQRLVMDRLARAQDSGLSAVYLLTTTAAAFFVRLDFLPNARSDVPAGLAASEEFARACPASATCLARRVQM